MRDFCGKREKERERERDLCTRLWLSLSIQKNFKHEPFPSSLL